MSLTEVCGLLNHHVLIVEHILRALNYTEDMYLNYHANSFAALKVCVPSPWPSDSYWLSLFYVAEWFIFSPIFGKVSISQAGFELNIFNPLASQITLGFKIGFFHVEAYI